MCRAPQRPEEGTGILETELCTLIWVQGTTGPVILQPRCFNSPSSRLSFPVLRSPPLPFFYQSPYTGSTIPYTCLPSFLSQLAFGFSQLPGLAPTGMQRALLPPLQYKAGLPSWISTCPCSPLVTQYMCVLLGGLYNYGILYRAVGGSITSLCATLLRWCLPNGILVSSYYSAGMPIHSQLGQ